MLCPYCPAGTPAKSSVVETQRSEDGRSIVRRRECSSGHRFSTEEIYKSGFVVKRGGRREPFDRIKLRNSIELAVNKTEVDADAVEDIVRDAERLVLKNGAVSGHEIAGLVLDRLSNLDDVAYLRFHSVFNRYRNASQFTETAELLKVRRIVVKRNGSTQPFRRDKFARGLMAASNRRPNLPPQIIEATVDRVIGTFGNEQIIHADELAKRALIELLKLDEVAYLRFASFANDYTSFDDFLAEIDAVRSTDQQR